MDLSIRGMVRMPGDAILGMTDIAPRRLDVVGTGAQLVDLMELKRIDTEDIQAVAESLSKESPYG